MLNLLMRTNISDIKILKIKSKCLATIFENFYYLCTNLLTNY